MFTHCLLHAVVCILFHETSVCNIVITKPLLQRRFGDNIIVYLSNRLLTDCDIFWFYCLFVSQFELQTAPHVPLSGMMQLTLVPGHENEKRSGNNLMALTWDQITIFYRWMSELFPPETVASGFWWCKNSVWKINLFKSNIFLSLWKQPSADMLAKILWSIFLSCLRIN